MNEKVLILTYYWPPSGGSGVQRWMYFAKYLPANGVVPYVVTVSPKKASYKFIDESFLKHVEGINVVHTATREPLKLYSKLTTGKKTEGIPQAFAGESKPGFFKKIARYVRGNYFIPDARRGWNKFAFKAACDLIEREGIKKIITTGPPHSTHLIGLKLKEKYNIKWVADFRDPWREIYYNNLLYRTKRADAIDAKLEKKVIETADLILTIGPGMQKILNDKIPGSHKFKFLYNGFDEELFQNNSVYKRNSEKIVITHIGLLAESQPIDGFLESLNNIVCSNNELKKILVLRLIGKVSEIIFNQIKNISPWLSVEKVNYVQHKDAIAEMCKADILLNSLADTKQSGYLVSGKLMEYIASGRPILCLGDETGDAAQLLNGISDCKVIERKNKVGMEFFLANLIKELLKGDDCGHTIEKALQFSRKRITLQLAEVLKQL